MCENHRFAVHTFGHKSYFMKEARILTAQDRQSIISQLENWAWIKPVEFLDPRGAAPFETPLSGDGENLHGVVRCIAVASKPGQKQFIVSLRAGESLTGKLPSALRSAALTGSREQYLSAKNSCQISLTLSAKSNREALEQLWKHYAMARIGDSWPVSYGTLVHVEGLAPAVDTKTGEFITLKKDKNGIKSEGSLYNATRITVTAAPPDERETRTFGVGVSTTTADLRQKALEAKYGKEALEQTIEIPTAPKAEPATKDDIKAFMDKLGIVGDDRKVVGPELANSGVPATELQKVYDAAFKPADQATESEW